MPEIKYEINQTSILWLTIDYAKLLIYNSVRTIILAWLSMSISIVLFIVCIFFEFEWTLFIVGTVFLLYGFIAFGRRQFIVIDVQDKFVTYERSIFAIKYSSNLIDLDDERRLTYFAELDTSGFLSHVALVVYNTTTTHKKVLVNFKDLKSAKKFLKVFNKKYPHFKIVSSTDSELD